MVLVILYFITYDYDYLNVNYTSVSNKRNSKEDFPLWLFLSREVKLDWVRLIIIESIRRVQGGASLACPNSSDLEMAKE